MITITLILIIAAIICAFLALCGVASRVNLTALAALLLGIALLIGRATL